VGARLRTVAGSRLHLGQQRSTPGREIGSDLFRPDLPFALQVELTSRCNLRCRMCPLTTGTTASGADPGAMTEVVFEELLRIARRCRLVVVAGYGEPLADRRCLPLLRALDAEGIGIHLATNGLTLTPSLSRDLAALSHLAHINVSIDSPDADCYREIRGGNVERALAGVGHLMAAVSDPGRVVVSSVAMLRNVRTLVDFPAVLAPLGVRHYRVQGIMEYNAWAVSQSLLDQYELADVVGALEATCRDHGIQLELVAEERSLAELGDPARARRRFYGDGDWDERTTRECTVPWELPYIDKDGRVYACCFAGAADERQFGRLGPQTFADIWHGEPARAFRRDLMDGSTTPAICRACTVTPLGPHPFASWAASLVDGGLEVTDGRDARVRVRVRNDGTRTWRPSDLVRIGTHAPRDGASPLEHPSWLGPTRTTTFDEAHVDPGSMATFAFPIRVPDGETATGAFQVIVEGVRWLPNTQFTVTAKGARITAADRVSAMLRRRSGPGARALLRPVRTIARRG
jgi:radical SAM protein with 4Fe4S-binding SPASM domain